MRVVIVEDDADIAELAADMVRYAGYDVALAADAEQARALDWSHVDVAVIDWMLPGQSGLDLAAWLAEAWPDVARIIVTAAPEALTHRHGHPSDPLVSKGSWPWGLEDALRDIEATRGI